VLSNCKPAPGTANNTLGPYAEKAKDAQKKSTGRVARYRTPKAREVVG